MYTRGALQRQFGLTMMELIIFILVMGVAVTAVLGALSSITAHSADPLLRKQAMLRAESLLEEVSLAHFTFCHPDDANAETATSEAGCGSLPESVGPRAGDTRPYFNINDYVTAFGVATSFNPADPSGNTVTDVTGAPMTPAGFQARVTITPVAAFGPAGMSIGSVAAPLNSADADVLLISVDVAYGPSNNGTREHVTLERYRTRYAPNSMP